MPSGAPTLLGLAVLCAAPLRAACECWPRDSRVDAWEDDVCSGLGPAECEGGGNATTGERCCWGCRDNEMLQFVGTVRPSLPLRLPHSLRRPHSVPTDDRSTSLRIVRSLT